MQQEIIFKFLKGGKTSVEVNGVCNEDCKELTAPFEEALGEVDDVQLKPEYYEEVEVAEQHVEE